MRLLLVRLLPDGTKPLPETMLTNHLYDSVTFLLRVISQDEVTSAVNHKHFPENYSPKIFFKSPSPGANELMAPDRIYEFLNLQIFQNHCTIHTVKPLI